MTIPKEIRYYLDQIKLPEPDSHKGQNGKLLIIGGSELFHAASKWSLDVASKFVDMVFYSSIPENNELVKAAKANFWDGIVVPQSSLDDYLEEADCILIGPGMERDTKTEVLVNQLLNRYSNKKWVIDAGALQMVDPSLIKSQYVLTPHHQELEKISNNFTSLDKASELVKSPAKLAAKINQPLILLKGPVDEVYTSSKMISIEGGNAGMTKGGTGDVLAGLVAALYCTHQAAVAAVVGSFINKKAGESLYHRVGPYYNASDLVSEVPLVFWNFLKK